ncbi:MAG: hypothetical protein ACJA07_001489 [Rhodococcus sp. (in: high G+C Gram-positive bacteria)]|jgi:hypothetical protein
MSHIYRLVDALAGGSVSYLVKRCGLNRRGSAGETGSR